MWSEETTILHHASSVLCWTRSLKNSLHSWPQFQEVKVKDGIVLDAFYLVSH